MTSKNGQILLITLLVLAVAMTIALSLIVRSTSDVSISNQLTESSQAFNAAEAGIELALKASELGTMTGTVGSATYSTTTSTTNSPSQYTFPKKTTMDSVETAWLVAHSGTALDETSGFSGDLTVCWSSETVAPAVLVSVWYKLNSDGSYHVARVGYDPDASRIATNHFVQPTGTGCAGVSGYSQTLDMSTLLGASYGGSKILFARLQPLYANTSFAIATSDAVASPLPAQGNIIESSGTVGSGVTRRVIVYEQYKSPSPLFDHVIYSQGSFSQ